MNKNSIVLETVWALILPHTTYIELSSCSTMKLLKIGSPFCWSKSVYVNDSCTVLLYNSYDNYSELWQPARKCWLMFSFLHSFSSSSKNPGQLDRRITRGKTGQTTDWWPEVWIAEIESWRGQYPSPQVLYHRYGQRARSSSVMRKGPGIEI